MVLSLNIIFSAKKRDGFWLPARNISLDFNSENPIKPVAIHKPLMGNLIRQKRITLCIRQKYLLSVLDKRSSLGRHRRAESRPKADISASAV